MTQTPEAERKTLILTGASRGIGHATVKRFSTAGWRVISCSRHPFPEDCPWDAGPEDHIQVDLSDSADTAAAILRMKDKLKEQGSKLHALVNNAAISPKKPDGGRLNTIETDEADWKKVFQVNFFAPVMLARGLIDELEAAKGAVVNVTSIAARASIPLPVQLTPPRKQRSPRLPVKWLLTSAPSACGLIPSPPAKSKLRSFRPAPRRSSRKFPSAASASPRKWPRRFIFCVRTVPAT